MNSNFWEWAHSVFTLISLAATVPAVTICVMILMSWHAQYIIYCKTRNKSPSMVLIAGIYIAFWGSMVDNVWWGIAWTGEYIHAPWRDWFFRNGVYPNTFFRQFALIWAGGLHVSAENMSKETPQRVTAAKNRTRSIIALSILAGALFSFCLYVIRRTAGI